MNCSKRSRLACLVLAGCCVAGPALATNPPDPQAAPAQSSANNAAMAHKVQVPSEPKVTDGTAPANTVNYQGVMVAIDPVTGRLREPTAEQREKLAAAMRQKDAGTAHTESNIPLNAEQARATLHRRTKGPPGLSMQLPMSLENKLMVDRNADGSLDIHHVGDKKVQGTTAVEQ